MAFEEVKDNIEDLKEQAKELLEANVRYYKLWGFKILVQSAGSILKLALLAMMAAMVILFFSIALALGIGYWLDNFAYGFLIVGGIYFIVGIIVYYKRNSIVDGPVLSNLSRILLKRYD